MEKRSACFVLEGKPGPSLFSRNMGLIAAAVLAGFAGVPKGQARVHMT